VSIHYEPHPVTPERKAELRAKGLTILDAAFAPEGWQADVVQAQDETKAETEAEAKPVRRGRPRKAAE
jgi:hypothetical protein